MELVGKLHGVKHKFCNSFSSPIYIQVLIKRRALKKYNQPPSKNNFANINCCNHKNVRKGDKQRKTNKKLVCKRTKISTTSSTNFLYRIFHVQKGYTGIGPEKKFVKFELRNFVDNVCLIS